MCAAVMSNETEDKLLNHLTGLHILSIPTAHHFGQPLEIEVKLALRTIINVV